MLWCRRHESEQGAILAVADQELMDMEFEEGELVLKVTGFFRGELVKANLIAEHFEDVGIINAVGEKAVAKVIKNGLATPSCVKRVGGVPHVQVFKINI